MISIGLKLWSINDYYIEDAQRLYQNGLYQYIELYSVPNSYSQFIECWAHLNIPYIIHAPHSNSGLNLSKYTYCEQNLAYAKEAFAFADRLHAPIVIFHPGIDGDISETVRQLKEISDSRIVIENKPYYTMDAKMICNGYSPEQIAYVMKETGVGFCLDIGHAIFVANALKTKPIEFLDRFLELKPTMYHLSDGDFTGVTDQHLHYGQGTFPITQILKHLPKPFQLTIETNKDYRDRLCDFEEDARSLLSKLHNGKISS